MFLNTEHYEELLDLYHFIRISNETNEQSDFNSIDNQSGFLMPFFFFKQKVSTY